MLHLFAVCFYLSSGSGLNYEPWLHAEPDNQGMKMPTSGWRDPRVPLTLCWRCILKPCQRPSSPDVALVRAW